VIVNIAEDAGRLSLHAKPDVTAALSPEKSNVIIFAGYLTWRSGAATVYILDLANFCRHGGAPHTKNG
jgi:hypothetical protein